LFIEKNTTQVDLTQPRWTSGRGKLKEGIATPAVCLVSRYKHLTVFDTKTPAFNRQTSQSTPIKQQRDSKAANSDRIIGTHRLLSNSPASLA